AKAEEMAEGGAKALQLQQEFRSDPQRLSVELANLANRRHVLLDLLQDLDYELFDLEPLYVIAQNQSLWECCLQILAFSQENGREDVICALYTNIFRAEIAAAKVRKVA